MGIDVGINPFGILDKAFGFSEKKRQKREDQVAQRNYNQAKEFAQNSMQWKAQDLRKAGINPIYAMGAGGYSAPVSTSSPTDLAPSGNVGFSKKLENAQANLINSQAKKVQAEAKATHTVGDAIKKTVDNSTPDYQYFTGVDGKNRIAMSQEASEAYENDILGRLGWHGRSLKPMTGNTYEEYRNNLWNQLLTKGKVNPFTQDIIMDADGDYRIVSKLEGDKHYYKEKKRQEYGKIMKEAMFGDGKPWRSKKRSYSYPFSR